MSLLYFKQLKPQPKHNLSAIYTEKEDQNFCGM